MSEENETPSKFTKELSRRLLAEQFSKGTVGDVLASVMGRVVPFDSSLNIPACKEFDVPPLLVEAIEKHLGYTASRNYSQIEVDDLFKAVALIPEIDMIVTRITEAYDKKMPISKRRNEVLQAVVNHLHVEHITKGKLGEQDYPSRQLAVALMSKNGLGRRRALLCALNRAIRSYLGGKRSAEERREILSLLKDKLALAHGNWAAVPESHRNKWWGKEERELELLKAFPEGVLSFFERLLEFGSQIKKD